MWEASWVINCRIISTTQQLYVTRYQLLVQSTSLKFRNKTLGSNQALLVVFFMNDLHYQGALNTKLVTLTWITAIIARQDPPLRHNNSCIRSFITWGNVRYENVIALPCQNNFSGIYITPTKANVNCLLWMQFRRKSNSSVNSTLFCRRNIALIKSYVRLNNADPWSGQVNIYSTNHMFTSYIHFFAGCCELLSIAVKNGIPWRGAGTTFCTWHNNHS